MQALQDCTIVRHSSVVYPKDTGSSQILRNQGFSARRYRKNLLLAWKVILPPLGLKSQKFEHWGIFWVIYLLMLKSLPVHLSKHNPIEKIPHIYEY